MPAARTVKATEIDRAGEVGFLAFGGSLENWQRAAHQHVEWYGLERLLVVEMDGVIVSSMLIMPEGMYLGSSVVPSAAVGGVATIPEARRFGCAAAMMEETVRRMRADGVATSAMWPFSFAYYRKFGWEWGGEARVMTWPRDMAFLIEPKGHVSVATSANVADLAAVWDATATANRCATVRVESDWQWLLRDVDFGGNRPNKAGLVCHQNGVAAGYILYDVPELVEGEEAQPVAIREFRATNQSAQVALVQALAARVDRQRFQAAFPISDSLRHVAVNARAFEAELHANFGFRVIDPALIFPTMSTDSAHEPFTLGVDDVLQGRRAWRLSFPGGPVEARETTDAPDARCSIQTFSQMASGLLKPAVAAGSGLLQGPATTIAALSAATAGWDRPFRSGLERG